ncbi:MBL fold metallo-hydrolase [Chloroflexota bacterium]
MNIRILGAHNCESSATKCTCILIDDTLAIDAGGLTSNLSITDQQKIQSILLTHQHYDHIRDIPGIALNFATQGTSINVYSTPDVRDTIETHLLNGKIYPKFQELPEAKPTVNFNLITAYESQRINGHRILPVPVNHDDNAVGYMVIDAKGKTIFYTSDTGPGLMNCWKYVSPQLLIIDVTLSNRHEEFATNTGHLTPRLLNHELIKFRELKGYLPRIIIVHMDPTLEKEIREEVAVVAEAMDASITLAHEGMQLHI